MIIMTDNEITTTEQLAEVAAAETPVEAVPAVDLPQTPLFGRYTMEGIEVKDPGLARYINLQLVGLPHSSARHANKRFAKQNVNVVERLINGIMRTGTYQGKKGKAYKVVREAFDRIHEKTGDNPVQIFVQAIEASAPREEVTRLRYGGINVPKSVDVAPLRRVDLAIRNIAKGGISGTFKSSKPVHQCLSDEILKAAKADQASFAVSKKEEVERVAKSAR